MTHHPKGSMCMACAHARRDCSALEFRSMPVLERYAGMVVVRCREFERQDPKSKHGNCPECGTPLAYAKAIAFYCPNNDCHSMR